MMLAISRAVAARLRALGTAPLEQCGLLLGGGAVVTRFVHTPNRSASPADSFEIDPAALIAAHRAERAGGDKLIGYFHSHPRGAAIPSPRDIAAAPGDGRPWLIASRTELRGWYVATTGVSEATLQFVDDKCVSSDTDLL